MVAHRCCLGEIAPTSHFLCCAAEQLSVFVRRQLEPAQKMPFHLSQIQSEVRYSGLTLSAYDMLLLTNTHKERTGWSNHFTVDREV